MKSPIKRTGTLLVFAPVLAVWVFLSLATAVAAQPVDAARVAAREPEQSLRVSLWLNKESDQVFRRGEPIEVMFQTNEDAYAVLYHIDVDGRVEVLWPTSRYSDGFVFGGHQYRLPSRDGDRLRAGEDEGVGYVQAVISRYPFDLRDLELDFHHENGGGRFDFYVAGDPFLAMNEVNYAVTGLEDPSEYVVTNYASYYVHRPVDHPRYLCSQCHDDSPTYDPYRDTCTVNVRFDYAWMNEWWHAYGYYPAYYYPVYYYVDPWTHFQWVNYWYFPWYAWPSVVVFHWDDHCYDWCHSPYWRGNCYTVTAPERRRYRPLDKTTMSRDRDAVAVRTKNERVTDQRPADDRIRVMKDRVVMDRADDRGGDRLDAPRPVAGGTAGNVGPSARAQERFDPGNRIRATAGLRVPGRSADADARSTGSGATRSPQPGKEPPVEARDDRLSGEQPGGRQPRDGTQAIRPVEPRSEGGRTWSSRRAGSAGDPRPTSPPLRPESRRGTQPGQPDESGNSGIRSGGGPGERGPANAGRPDSNHGARDGRGNTTIERPAKPSTPPPAVPRSGGSGSSGSNRGGESKGGRSGGRSGGNTGGRG